MIRSFPLTLRCEPQLPSFLEDLRRRRKYECKEEGTCSWGAGTRVGLLAGDLMQGHKSEGLADLKENALGSLNTMPFCPHWEGQRGTCLVLQALVAPDLSAATKTRAERGAGAGCRDRDRSWGRRAAPPAGRQICPRPLWRSQFSGRVQ